mmetsp:Transcript_3740/g.7950  ORF Transcript_3740/g.7950 Transcript_3740/m.7950 type:complete len:92 (-) Transcript_3740:146-421(-)
MEVGGVECATRDRISRDLSRKSTRRWNLWTRAGGGGGVMVRGFWILRRCRCGGTEEVAFPHLDDVTAKSLELVDGGGGGPTSSSLGVCTAK